MPDYFRITDLLAGSRVDAGNERSAYIIGMSSLDAAGRPIVRQENLTLVTNSVASANQSAYGGDYSISAVASNWNGASVQVQYLGPDGSTWLNIGRPRTANDVNDTANANSPQGIGLISNASVRAVITGSATGLYLNLGRIPA